MHNKGEMIMMNNCYKSPCSGYGNYGGCCGGNNNYGNYGDDCYPCGGDGNFGNCQKQPCCEEKKFTFIVDVCVKQKCCQPKPCCCPKPCCPKPCCPQPCCPKPRCYFPSILFCLGCCGFPRFF